MWLDLKLVMENNLGFVFSKSKKVKSRVGKLCTTATFTPPQQVNLAIEVAF